LGIAYYFEEMRSFVQNQLFAVTKLNIYKNKLSEYQQPHQQQCAEKGNMK
jgi:hypothetical protein